MMMMIIIIIGPILFTDTETYTPFKYLLAAFLVLLLKGL
jgi:hypothetical protein